MAGKRVTRMLAQMSATATGLALITAGCWIGETMPAPAHASASFDEVVHLTSAQAVAVRHISFEMSPPNAKIGATIAVEGVRIIKGVSGEFPDGVTVSVIPDDPTTLDLPAPTVAPAPRSGAAFDLQRLCATGCHSGVIVVVRRTKETAPPDDIHLFATIQVWDAFEHGPVAGGTPLPATLDIEGDGAPTFDGIPSALVSTVQQTLAYSSGTVTPPMALRLTIDPAALSAPLTYPLVGRIIVQMVPEGADITRLVSACCDPAGTLTVGDRVTSLHDGGAVDMDWLGQCQPSVRCNVVITINPDKARLTTLAFLEAEMNSQSPAASGAAFRMTVTVRVTLEAFDDRTLPAGGLTLWAN